MAHLKLGLLLTRLTLCEQQVTVALPLRGDDWDRLAQDSDMQEGPLVEFLEPKEPSKCQATSLSTWAD